MRVAYIVSVFPSISETFVLSQITGLLDNGHDVYIYADKNPNDHVVHSDYYKYNLSSRTTYANIPNGFVRRLTFLLLHLSVLLFKNPKQLLSIITRIRFLLSGDVGDGLKLLYKSIFFFSRDHFDVIHCHFGPNGIVGMKLREMGNLNGKLVTTFHGYDISQYFQSGRVYYRELFRRGDLFLPISDSWRKKLLQIGCEPNKIMVHHMGIDTHKFQYLLRAVQEQAVVKLISVCRFVEKKGLSYALAAFSQVLQDFPNCEYYLVGGGPLHQELVALAKQLHIENKVIFCGQRHQGDVVRLLNDAHLFLAPSVTADDGDQEGIPVSIMEAMAMGLPVVATWHSGIPELVQDGLSGYLVPEKDAEGLKAVLVALLEHPEKWAELGLAGRQFVKDQFDILLLNKQLEELFLYYPKP